MRFTPDTLRGWLVPAALVFTATVLTVPWSYWVIKAAYDRDVLDNAKSLARRVESRVMLSPQTAGYQAADALRTELATDPTVQSAVFYNLTHNPPQPVGWTRTQNDLHSFNLPIAELRRRALGTLVEQSGDRYVISVPWQMSNHTVGVTYLELSRQALSDLFWQKEGTLVTRVIALTAAAILVLSVVGIYAYGTRQKIGVVREQAELTQQGLVAERGLTAAVLAHEIRNPLAALRFQLHSLRRNVADASRVTNTADTIDNELSRIQQLVTDYLEHEKARSMAVQTVDLVQSARSLQALLEDLFHETHTELVVDAPPRPVDVTCDPHALRQVLMNLALNAHQAIRDHQGSGGRVTLRVAGDDPTFGSIDVADTGPGIPPEMRDRLFKPFQTSRSEGHGIGLALVKRFVDNFGGSVTVDSEPGRGATFHLKLPRVDQPGVATRDAAPPALASPAATVEVPA